LVEDDETSLMLAENALTAAGFTVRTFLDALLALQEAQRGWPDLIVTDVMMPRMTGFELCARACGLPGGQALPVLVTTALGDTDSIDRAYVAGATGFATKPVNWEIEIHRLRYMLRAAEIAKAAGRAEFLNQPMDPECAARTLAKWKSKAR
jgi:DNA-binding response OmpR family regulator